MSSSGADSASEGGGIIALTAPSGAGKTTIARRLLAAIPSLRFSVSATTRPMRKGEEDGRDYHFLTEAAFRDRIDRGDLLEVEEVYPGRLYGTLKSEVEHATAGRPVLLDIDVMGAKRVKELFGSRALVIFIRPPSIDVLFDRLRRRGTESPRDLEARMERARRELAFADDFDVFVVNDELPRAIEETIGLVLTFLKSGSSTSPSPHGLRSE